MKNALVLGSVTSQSCVKFFKKWTKKISFMIYNTKAHKEAKRGEKTTTIQMRNESRLVYP